MWSASSADQPYRLCSRHSPDCIAEFRAGRAHRPRRGFCVSLFPSYSGKVWQVKDGSWPLQGMPHAPYDVQYYEFLPTLPTVGPLNFYEHCVTSLRQPELNKKSHGDYTLALMDKGNASFPCDSFVHAALCAGAIYFLQHLASLPFLQHLLSLSFLQHLASLPFLQHLLSLSFLQHLLSLSFLQHLASLPFLQHLLSLLHCELWPHLLL